MTKTGPARKKLPERHSYDVKSHSNVPNVKRATGTVKKLRMPKKGVKDNEPAEPQECSICMDTRKFKYYETVLCGHSFHTNCIQSWLKNADTCPNCRKPLKQPRENQQQRPPQAQQSQQLPLRQHVSPQLGQLQEFHQRHRQLQQQHQALQQQIQLRRRQLQQVSREQHQLQGPLQRNRQPSRLPSSASARVVFGLQNTSSMQVQMECVIS